MSRRKVDAFDIASFAEANDRADNGKTRKSFIEQLDTKLHVFFQRNGIWNTADVDDLVQITLERAIVAAKRGGKDEPSESLAFVIAKRRLQDFRRRQYRDSGIGRKSKTKQQHDNVTAEPRKSQKPRWPRLLPSTLTARPKERHPSINHFVNEVCTKYGDWAWPSEYTLAMRSGPDRLLLARAARSYERMYDVLPSSISDDLRLIDELVRDNGYFKPQMLAQVRGISTEAARTRWFRIRMACKEYCPEFWELVRAIESMCSAGEAISERPEDQ